MAAPVITTTEIPVGRTNVPYKFQMEATGENLTWNSPNIHQDLYITPEGEIKGSPMYTPGDFTFTVNVSNSEGSDSKDFNLTVLQYKGEPVILTEKFPPIFNGVYYSINFIEYSAYGNPFWTFTGLPEGFTQQEGGIPYADGVSYTLEVGATITIGVEVVNEWGRDYREYEVEILDSSAMPVIETWEIPPGKVGVPYSFQLEGSSTTPATWFMDEYYYTIPQGLKVSKTGLISGVPLVEEEVYTVFNLQNKYDTVWRGFSIVIEANPDAPSGGDGTEAWWAINVIQGGL